MLIADSKFVKTASVLKKLCFGITTYSKNIVPLLKFSTPRNSSKKPLVRIEYHSNTKKENSSGLQPSVSLNKQSRSSVALLLRLCLKTFRSGSLKRQRVGSSSLLSFVLVANANFIKWLRKLETLYGKFDTDHLMLVECTVCDFNGS